MKKIVCVYNLSKEHEQVIESLLAKQNITIVKLNEKLLNQKIGAVAQLPDFSHMRIGRWQNQILMRSCFCLLI